MNSIRSYCVVVASLVFLIVGNGWAAQPTALPLTINISRSGIITPVGTQNAQATPSYMPQAIQAALTHAYPHALTVGTKVIAASSESDGYDADESSSDNDNSEEEKNDVLDRTVHVVRTQQQEKIRLVLRRLNTSTTCQSFPAPLPQCLQSALANLHSNTQPHR